MTSPSIRRQRQSDRQDPIPQPDFGGPANTGQMGSASAAGPLAPAQGTTDWNQMLLQGFQSRHALRLQNRGRQRPEPNEGLSVVGPSVPVQGRVDQNIPIAGPSAPIAGPSRPVQDRVDWNSRFQQGFQARHNQRRQNHGYAPANQIHSGVIEPQDDMQQQQRYADEERQHTAHLAALRQQQEQQREQMERDRLAELHQQQEQQRQMGVVQQQVLQQEAAEHLQVAINNNQALRNVPKGCRPYKDPAFRHSLGPMNVSCPNCHALHFQSEKLVNSSNVHPKFGVCCLQGQIQLPSISHSPPLLHQLLNSSTPRARKFRDSICQYNSAFAFTSVAMEVDNAVLNGRGPYSFRLHGAMYHKMGSLHPQDGQQPVYAQLYIYDDQAALAARNSRNPNLDPFLMEELQQMLIANNPFVPLYKQAYQIMQESPPELQSNLQMSLVLQQGDDRRRYNLPTVDEIAAIIPGTGEEDVDHNRDIVLCYKHGGLHNISHLHPLYAPLHYVLLFPNGDQGWHRYIDIVRPEGRAV